MFSLCDTQHRWDRSARMPLWRLYNARKRNGESIRVFPLLDWTELDVWLYIHEERIQVMSLRFAAPHTPVVCGSGH
jgi:sulfate adenylyltransferase subunit 2